MKTLFLSLALSVCTLFALYSFTVKNHSTPSKVVKKPLTVSSWPITGTVLSVTLPGTVAYEIYGAGSTAPNYVRITSLDHTIRYGDYFFTPVTGSTGSFEAGGMNAQLGLVFKLHIYPNQVGYTLEFGGVSSLN